MYGDGKIAVMTLTLDALGKSGAAEEECDWFVNLARSVQGVEAAVLLKQRGAREIKVSLRSNRYVDVASLAQELGGGGHIRAAGCTLYETAEVGRENYSGKTAKLCVIKVIWVNGIINLYKPSGITSHGAVARVRRICGMKKVGHTGTLDPMAQGVLPICLGKATKAAGLLTDAKKRYQAVMELGKVTDSQDSEGTLLQENPVHVTEEELKQAAAQFQGEFSRCRRCIRQ